MKGAAALSDGPFLCRALSEAETKTKAELSANHTCALKECKSETQHEFSAAGSRQSVNGKQTQN